MSVIQVRELTKSFKGKKVIDNLNVTFESGKIYALLIIAVIFYILAVVKVKKKEFYVENA